MTNEEFEIEVIQRSYTTPVLVIFWIPWCGACILKPQLEVIHTRHRGEWTLVKINIDKNPSLSIRYHVDAVPTVKLFSRGRVINEFAGALPGHIVEEWIKGSLQT